MSWIGDAIAHYPLGFAFLALLIGTTAFVAGVFVERARSEHIVAEVTRLRCALTRSSRSGW
jgi:hypothetical protein